MVFFQAYYLVKIDQKYSRNESQIKTKRRRRAQVFFVCNLIGMEYKDFCLFSELFIHFSLYSRKFYVFTIFIFMDKRKYTLNNNMENNHEVPIRNGFFTVCKCGRLASTSTICIHFKNTIFRFDHFCFREKNCTFIFQVLFFRFC